MCAAEKNNPVVELSFQFALEILKFTSDSPKNFSSILMRQLFRSGTSIGSNIRESQGAQSRNDFIHKMKIAYKEAEETEYWLMLCKSAEGYPDPGELLNGISELKKLMGKIIATATRNGM